MVVPVNARLNVTDATWPIVRTFRFVRWEHAADFLRLGWCPNDTLADTYHEQWAVCMEWLCGCMLVEPRRVGMTITIERAKPVTRGTNG